MVHSLSPLFVLTCPFIWIGLSFVVLFRYNHLTRGSSWWMVGVFSGKMMITMVPYSNLFFFSSSLILWLFLKPSLLGIVLHQCFIEHFALIQRSILWLSIHCLLFFLAQDCYVILSLHLRSYMCTHGTWDISTHSYTMLIGDIWASGVE